MTLLELAAWHTRYDSATYSPQIYKELVVEGNEHPDKFAIMGAWKTGCLQMDDLGTAYTDRHGTKYSYSKRWDDHTPVGKSTWTYINENQAAIKSKVPNTFPADKPAILNELQNRKGFGFIWGLFTLHCFYPEVYPLYDQHVYRAYKNYIDDSSYPILAPDNWQEYTNYRYFFFTSINELDLPYWQFDQALWAYGKSIKPSRITRQKINTKAEEHDAVCPGGYSWKSAMTLGGGRAKPFCWRMSGNDSLHIARKFRSKDSWYWEMGFFTRAEINMILDYMEPIRWVPLANNVEKLRNGTEQDGLGKFIYDEIESSTSTAQLASHIAAIFYQAGNWKWNEKQTKMQFKKIPM